MSDGNLLIFKESDLKTVALLINRKFVHANLMNEASINKCENAMSDGQGADYQG